MKKETRGPAYKMSWAVLLCLVIFSFTAIEVSPVHGQQRVVIDVGTFDFTTLSIIYPQFVFRPIDDTSPRVGARAMGMGGAYLAEAKGAEALGWNPALLAFSPENSLVADVFSKSSSSTASSYPLGFTFPDTPPMFITSYKENLKSQTRFGFIGISGKVMDLASRPVVGGIAYRRHTDVIFPEEMIAELLYQEGAGIPIVAANDLVEDGAIEAATFGVGYEVLPHFGLGASFNLLTGRLRSHMATLRNVSGLPLDPGNGHFNLDYKGISFEAGAHADLGRVSLGGWIGLPHTIEVSGGSFSFQALEVPGQPPTLIIGRMGGYDLEVPLSFSLGAGVDLLPGLLATADFNVRSWGDAKVKYHSPEVRAMVTASEVYPAYNVESFHIGMEYRLLNKSWYSLPVRAGYSNVPLSMANVDGNDVREVNTVPNGDGTFTAGDGDPIFFGSQVKSKAWSLGASLEMSDITFHMGFESRSYELHRFFFESSGPLSGDYMVNPDMATPLIKRIVNTLRISGEFRF
ncbi:MAG: hypothetical protein KJ970_00530 [Candidatus Eisenbacteria bacterium]|uniref:PorV/PorQ family protein n=1 Tax=Eiseniibacteriota bacterium TaxID=2212470 RepID=A0A948RR73_UNCEI|nr:hypothetical protein [Candidatus Eisenbacteria bacterium]MBU1948629.1 hypothetical protein [Candidatus Eisenbacteria bacterium]MBU2689385.1 hypothetical protein [Candidatus Eisenbacteria bacterium]